MRVKPIQLVFLCLFLSSTLPAQTPPFGGTIFLDPDIITEEDPTSFVSLSEAGQGMRTMFDRRVNNWVNKNAYLFNATYVDDKTIEIQVNPEFGSVAAAKVEAEKYAPVLGRLPKVLLKDAETVWIHKGVNPFGGGNNNYLIHTGQAALYERDGILEETLVHEGAHTSLDDPHASSSGWLQAQKDDPTFISTYARDNPSREDIAESFLPYLMIRYRADKITASLKKTIEESIPNRIAYFDNQHFDLSPFATISNINPASQVINNLQIAPNPIKDNFNLQLELAKTSKVRIAIYDLQGKLIQRLMARRLNQGSHKLAFEINQLSSGSYTISIRIKEGAISQQIVVQ